MIELVKYMHTTNNFAYVLPGKYMSDPIEARFGWYRQANDGNFFMSIKQLLLTEKNSCFEFTATKSVGCSISINLSTIC